MISFKWNKVNNQDHLFQCQFNGGLINYITAILYNKKVMFQFICRAKNGCEFVIDELHFDYENKKLNDFDNEIMNWFDSRGSSIFL